MNLYLIVTGGGIGIGAEVSRKAAKKGYSACVNYHRDQTSAENVVRELKQKGDDVLVFRAYVSKEE